jgi:hypothetical protein
MLFFRQTQPALAHAYAPGIYPLAADTRHTRASLRLPAKNSGKKYLLGTG